MKGMQIRILVINTLAVRFLLLLKKEKKIVLFTINVVKIIVPIINSATMQPIDKMLVLLLFSLASNVL